jgi:hypothetical protein
MASDFDGYNDWREANGMDRMDPAFTHAKDWGQEWNSQKTVQDIERNNKPPRENNGRVSSGNDAGRSNWMPTERSLFGSDNGGYHGYSNYNMREECECGPCGTLCVRWCRGYCCPYGCCGYG